MNFQMKQIMYNSLLKFVVGLQPSKECFNNYVDVGPVVCQWIRGLWYIKSKMLCDVSFSISGYNDIVCIIMG